MISLTDKQRSILTSATLRRWWAFDVVTSGGDRYYWSTQDLEAAGSGVAHSWGKDWEWSPGWAWAGTIGRDYEYRITGFAGVNIERIASEVGVVAPSEMEFTVINTDTWGWGGSWEWGGDWSWGEPGGLVSRADMEGASVLLTLYVGDKDNAPVAMLRWRFRIRDVEPGYGMLRCLCRCWWSQYLTGTWPVTPTPTDQFPSNSDPSDGDYCIPFVVGEAYAPLRSAFISSQREYVLGPAGPTYSVSHVHTPRAWGASVEWPATGYDFDQATRTGRDGEDYRTLRPIIADSDGDTVADAMGLWLSGDYLDMPARYTRSDTASLTNPAWVIRAVLLDMGVPAEGIGMASFAAAAATYDSWGLVWSGGWWRRKDRQEVLGELLAMCHSTLALEEQIQLRVLSKAPVGTAGAANIVKGSFRWNALDQDQGDSIYMEWQQPGEPADYTLHTLVPAKSSTVSPSGDTVAMPLVHDSQLLQVLTSLLAQRLLLATARLSWSLLPGDLIAVQTDDVMRVAGMHYGGISNVLVESVKINDDLVLDFAALRMSDDLDDFIDLAFDALSIATDTTSESDVWTKASTGPDAA